MNEQPVGRIGLLNIGDVGRVKSVFVGGEYRRLGISLSHALSHREALS